MFSLCSIVISPFAVANNLLAAKSTENLPDVKSFWSDFSFLIDSCLMFNFLGFPFIAAGVSSSWAPSLIYLHWHVSVFCIVLSLLHLSLDFQAHRASCLWGIFHVMFHGFLKSILNEYSLTWLLFGKLSLIPFPFLMCLGGILDRITLFLSFLQVCRLHNYALLFE